MFRNFRKKCFRKAVRDLFINQHSGPFALNSLIQGESGLYREILSWESFNDQKLAKYQPKSLKIVNQAFADGLNKYEAAVLMMGHFLTVDTDEEGDCLIDDKESEYSKIYSLFAQNPIQLNRAIETLRNNGEICSEVFLKLNLEFDRLFIKYPELKDECPEEPNQISWWELSYNDSKNSKHQIIGRFINVTDVVEHIGSKEGGKELFWRYPFKCQYDDWEPTVPPTNDWNEKSFIAIPRRGWETLWKEYQGIGVGANFDHWEALKRQAYIRPKDKDIIIHRIIRKPYQRIMSLEIGAG